jgi:hypothetical protein
MMAYVKPNQPFLRRGDPLNQGVVGCWLMNEPCGPDTRDWSGRGNHATLVNGPARVMTEMGRGINCVKADLSSIATPVYINPKLPGSFFYWVRWQAISGSQTSGGWNSENRLHVGIYGQNAWVACGSFVSLNLPHGMTAGNWYHIGLTWDGALAEHWIDAKKILGFSYGSAGLISNPQHIGKLNGYTSGFGCTATFTSATIHSRVLAPAEIRRLAGLDGDPFEQWRPRRRRVRGLVRIVGGPYRVEHRHAHTAGGELQHVHTAGGRRRHVHAAGGALHATTRSG